MAEKTGLSLALLETLRDRFCRNRAQLELAQHFGSHCHDEQLWHRGDWGSVQSHKRYFCSNTHSIEAVEGPA